MTPAASTAELDHRALIYSSDGQLHDRLLPYLREGLERDEQVLAVVSAGTEEALRAALGPDAERMGWGATVGISYAHLGRVFEGLRSFLATQHAAGVPARIVGEYDHDSDARRLQQYLRYESMANEVYAPYGGPLVCLWDERRYESDVLAQVRATHPQLLDADGRSRSAEYREPARYLSEDAPSPFPADVELDVRLDVAVDLAPLRRRLAAWAAVRGAAGEDLDDVVTAAAEVATNAIEHGRPPARVRAWTEGGLLIVRVDDRGTAGIPATAGFRRPGVGSSRGRGLWIARQLADVVTTHGGQGGSTVQLYFPVA